MRRGTTPTIRITVEDVDLSLLDAIYVTLKQGGYILTKTGDDLTIDEDKISFTLTEEETLKYKAADEIQLQLRVIAKDGGRLASGIKRLGVSDILYNENI